MARKKPLPYFNALLIYSIYVINKQSGADAWIKTAWEGREFSDDGARALARDALKRKFSDLGLDVLDFELERSEYSILYRGRITPAYRKYYDGWKEGDDKRRLTVPEDFTDARNLYETRKS